ncbi:Uma2 family endonuclease [Rubrimonas cliftonensis]|uniref:Endonuclease, Uma2 family (Restriction endonuclease fold) n=1 Tax=Rubrimonas cliftonensis TaxID=89524 RepID=A0A1H4CT78_9RHOB|nr:Uma2 family endonuclease [Rubrimonas cliftonensis]SEA63630.1 Endonuclease, Uma2 family (restriction endonuclease fold) [Rubrimonas cliftonensis]
MTLQTLAFKRPATYQDVLDAPAHLVAELLDGALHLQPRPGARHARAASRLGVKLGGFDDDGPGGWWLLDEPEIHLGDHVLVPDLAGWRRANMPAFPDAPAIDLAPDWICEVLSPSTRRLDLGVKRDVYGAHGVSHLWFVDPDAQTLEAFACRGGAWVLLATLTGDAMVRLAPFEEAIFSLSALWPPSKPEPPQSEDI